MRLLLVALAIVVIANALGNHTMKLVQVSTASESLSGMRSAKIKAHNINAPIISHVSFNISEYSGNVYPIKIGQLLENAAQSNQSVRMTVESTAPVYFFFLKCGYRISHFPSSSLKKVCFESDHISLLQLLQDKKCENRTNDEVIYMNLVSGEIATSGTISFELSEDPETISQNKMLIRIYLIGLLVLMVVGSTITTISYFWTPYRTSGLLI